LTEQPQHGRCFDSVTNENDNNTYYHFHEYRTTCAYRKGGTNKKRGLAAIAPLRGWKIA
jgi:hypothetical protein